MARRSRDRGRATSPSPAPVRRARVLAPARVPFLKPLGIFPIHVRLGKRGSPKASLSIMPKTVRAFHTPVKIKKRTTLVAPRPALIVAQRTKNKSTLLGLPIHRDTKSPKQQIKRLCKCTNTRSEAQRRVSRKFFANGGGGSKQIQACEC